MCFLRYTGFITNVAAVVEHVGPPPIRAPLGVTDWRLQDREAGLEYVQYPIVGNAWLTTNDPVVRDKYERHRSGLMRLQSANVRGGRNAPEERRMAILLAMIAMSLGVGVWLLAARLRSQRNGGASQKGQR
ncbi:MAG: hypothetical protein KatS3mg132_458 [Limisphaera sp.]|nr:MAG: hypothetical protein KatS3mg132_458 [Limisphaera sp.]